MTTPLDKVIATIKERIAEENTQTLGLKYALRICEIALEDQKKNFALVDAELFRYGIYNAYNTGHDAGTKRRIPNAVEYFKNTFKKN